MPGGTPHVGEDPWDAAVRETTEEIGDLPPLKIARTFHHVEEDGKTQAYLWLVDVPYFQPKLNGDTPEETQGAAWFRKKEIGNLDLVDKFREDWDHSVHLKDNVTKAIRSTENGELLEEDPRYGAGTGSNWPYPRHADGSPALDGPDGRPVPQNNRPGGGYIEGEMGAIEPPFIQDDMSDEEHAVLYPNGTEENFPRRRARNRGPKKLPHGPDGQWPHTTTTKPGPGAQGVPGG
jgi:ADP-ribose pyrophosphatase YjhB (NUDIX family)